MPALGIDESGASVPIPQAPVYTPPPYLPPPATASDPLTQVGGGGTIFGYIPPQNPISTGGGGLPDLGGSSGLPDLGGGKSFADTFSSPDFQSLILNDPRYKQLLETLDEDKRIADERAAQELKWFKEEYERRKTDIGGAGSGVGSDAALRAMEQLEKEKAAHDKKLAEKAIKEQMAARGMTSSGQAGFEQGELQYDYETLLKQIDLQAQARQEARAAAAASASRARAGALADLEANYNEGLIRSGWSTQDRERALASAKGDALIKVAGYIWNEQGGVYVNGVGDTKTPQQAAQSVGTSNTMGVPYDPGFPTLDFSNYRGITAKDLF